MRLFIAIDLPDALKDRLAQMRADVPGAAWTRRDSFHLTLRFLGDAVPAERLPDLQAALSAPRLPTFDLALRGVGRFPPQAHRPPRVLWVGVAHNPALERLYRAVESAVTKLGFPPDDHAFSGHITLARLRASQPDQRVSAFLARQAAFRADPFPVGAFHLYSSTLMPQGAQYERLASFPLLTVQHPDEP